LPQKSVLFFYGKIIFFIAENNLHLIMYFFYSKKIKKTINFLLFMAFSIPFFGQKPKKILFFGDSITELGVQPNGYIDLMRQTIAKDSLTEKYTLIGAGIGGNKVYDLYLRLEEDVLAEKPSQVVVWVGINDVWHKRLAGTGTDADKFVKFYEAIIRKLKDKDIKVTLVTPAVIGERTDFSNASDGELNYYANLIRKLAIAHDLSIVDMRKVFLAYNLEHNKANKESNILTYDAVHLNDAGNRLVADTFLAFFNFQP
jgi:isoamyl acetate esterase